MKPKEEVEERKWLLKMMMMRGGDNAEREKHQTLENDDASARKKWGSKTLKK